MQLEESQKVQRESGNDFLEAVDLAAERALEKHRHDIREGYKQVRCLLTYQTLKLK